MHVYSEVLNPVELQSELAISWITGLVFILIPPARPKDFDHNLRKYCRQLTAIDLHMSHLFKNQIN